MVYKINLAKKKDFEKWNSKQLLKHLLPFIILGFILMNFITGVNLSSNRNEFTLPVSAIVVTIVISNVLLLLILYLSFFLSNKVISSKLESWEVNIEENYAVIKNSVATTTVNFADFKKFKKDDNSITFYFKGLRHFYLNWDCFNNSEQLKAELENIASRIGTFKKENSAEQPKTKVKFNSKIYIILAIIIIIKLIQFLKH